MHPRSPFKLQFQTKSPWSKKKKRKNVHNFANSTKKFNPYKMFFKTVGPLERLFLKETNMNGPHLL